MATTGEADCSLASKCMDFCQALASQGLPFHFTLNMGSTFTFSLDTRGKAKAGPVAKKKSSPSTQRRNARRERNSSPRKGNPFQLWTLQLTRHLHPYFLVTSVITKTSLKRGWGNTPGWSTRKPSWTISCQNLLLLQHLRAWDKVQSRPDSTALPSCTRAGRRSVQTVMEFSSPTTNVMMKVIVERMMMKRFTAVINVVRHLPMIANWVNTQQLSTNTAAISLHCVVKSSSSIVRRLNMKQMSTTLIQIIHQLISNVFKVTDMPVRQRVSTLQTM